MMAVRRPPRPPLHPTKPAVPRRFRPPFVRPSVAGLSAALLLAAVAPAGFAADGAEDVEAAQHRFFENEVRPLLAEHCFSCHGEAKQEGDLRLDSRGGLLAGGWSGPAATPGEPDASLLLEAVRYESYEMPPSGQLPAESIAVLAKWVELGAVWPGSDDAPPVREAGSRFTDEDRAWWALQPVTDPPVPKVADAPPGWGENPIDRFLLAAMRERGLDPAPEADRVTLIRRLTQDLTGLPPSPAEVDGFLADDRPDAYVRLVNRLLESQAYGERQARHWLDLVRYADSDGYRNDHHRPHAWRYRDYVVDRLNADVPYDRFVREQLAGDELFPGEPEAQVALGYLRAGIYEHNSREAPGQLDLMLNELTDTTADVFLGLGLQCARCHDHKFDPLLQTDYYRLRAHFEPLLFRDSVAATPEQKAEHAARLAEWEAATADLRAELEAIEGPARERGREKAVGKFPAEVQAIYRTPESEKTARDRQIAWFVQDQVRQEWDKIEGLGYIPAKHKPRVIELREQIAAFDELKPAPLPTARAAADAAATAPPTVVPKRGTEVDPGPIALLEPDPAPIPPLNAGSTGRRAALADWIADPANPLSTRVIVNRVWQTHFGRGLAPNGSDFGRLGGPPTHPELLDWLVCRFLEDGWRLKPLHRRIVTSAAYRQAATHPRAAALAETDPANDWYWRADVRRLAAEQVRDALLAATGTLEPAAGGPGRGHGAAVRSLYLTVKRNGREPLLDLFDLPQFFQSAAARDTTTSPLQSLYLINSEAVLGHAARLAARAAADTDEASVRNAWRFALGREPDTGEVALGVRFLREQAGRIGGASGSPARTETNLRFAPFPTRDGRAADLSPDRPSPLSAPLGADLAAAGGFTVEAFFEVRTVYGSGAVRTVAANWDGDRRTPGWSFGVTGKGSRRKPQTLVIQLLGRAADGADKSGAVTEAAVFSDQHVALNTPYHAAAVVRPATAAGPGSVTFFLKDLADDDAVASAATVPHGIAGGLANGLPVTIGRRAGGGGLFDGLIDDVRLTAGPLAAGETLLTDESPTAATLAHWSFEPAPGPLADSSGAGRDLLAAPVAAAAEDARRRALTDFCHVLLNSSEFLYVP